MDGEKNLWSRIEDSLCHWLPLLLSRIIGPGILFFLLSAVFSVEHLLTMTVHLVAQIVLSLIKAFGNKSKVVVEYDSYHSET